MTVTQGKSGAGERAERAQPTQVPCEEEARSPEPHPQAKESEDSPCKAKFQIYRENAAFLANDEVNDTVTCESTRVVSSGGKTNHLQQNCTRETKHCPFVSNDDLTPPETKSNKQCKKSVDGKENGRPRPTGTKTPEVAPLFPDLPPQSCLSACQAALPGRHTVAPLWSRARRLAAARGDCLPRRSDIEDAAEPAEPEPCWAPAPVDGRRRSRLFTALRRAGRRRRASGDRAVEDAVRGIIYRRHPALIAQRFCQPPASLYGSISTEEFILRGARPVHVYDDLFLGPASLSREEMVSMIRAGQYYHGHNVACFYAYLYSYEFVYFCEYLRRVVCHTPESRAVLRGVLQRAQNLHLISHSATLFSLAPEAMYTQRSPFVYLARLFPMQEPWEADLLCDMINSRDLVKEAATAWNRQEHALFTAHREMRHQARLDGGRRPPFHPAVIRLPSSAAAFSNIEGEQVERLDSHGLVVFQENGASYMDVDASCRFPPLGQLSTEEVLRRSVGRHALIRLFDDVFFLGAPTVDLHRAEIRYLRPAEVRLHVQVGFFFESPSYTSFLWNTRQSINRALRDACRMHAPQLSSEETALVRWLLQDYTDTSRRALHSSVRELARFGPYLLNEFGKTLWRVLSDDRLEDSTLQLCTDLSEHARSMLEAALAEHNCLAGN